jgi:drug/metabolite transporter (DMT)-like permease
MRALQISGAILIVIGLWMVIRPPSYTREESVIKLGDIEAKMQQEHSLPGWVGGMALGAGLVLLVVGTKKR